MGTIVRTDELDLNTILKDWPCKSGTVKVRQITGLDGRKRATRAEHKGEGLRAYPEQCAELQQEGIQILLSASELVSD